MAKQKNGSGASDTLRSTEQVIEALGGYHAVIKMTGATPQVVSNWKKFKTFPSNTYTLMQRQLARVGKQAPDSLWGMRRSEEV